MVARIEVLIATSQAAATRALDTSETSLNMGT